MKLRPPVLLSMALITLYTANVYAEDTATTEANSKPVVEQLVDTCLLYTSDAADE